MGVEGAQWRLAHGCWGWGWGALGGWVVHLLRDVQMRVPWRLQPLPGAVGRAPGWAFGRSQTPWGRRSLLWTNFNSREVGHCGVGGCGGGERNDAVKPGSEEEGGGATKVSVDVGRGAMARRGEAATVCLAGVRRARQCKVLPRLAAGWGRISGKSPQCADRKGGESRSARHWGGRRAAGGQVRHRGCRGPTQPTLRIPSHVLSAVPRLDCQWCCGGAGENLPLRG